MDYSTLLSQTQQLATHDKNMHHFTLGLVTYQPIEFFSTASDLVHKLISLGPVTGWLTWPNSVETLTTATTVTEREATAPLEGELVSATLGTIRVQYRDRRWALIQIKTQAVESGSEANCLLEETQLIMRDKSQAIMQYQRIWQYHEHQGMITNDAVFVGFGGKQ